MTNKDSYGVVDLDHKIQIDRLGKVFPILDANYEPVTKPIPDAGLYLVYDDWSGFIPDVLQNISDMKKVFIVAHTNGCNNYESLSLETNAYCLKGQHETRPNGRYYNDIIDIINMNLSPQKKYQKVWEKIFSVVYPLDIRLEILHRCFFHEGVQEVLNQLHHYNNIITEIDLKPLLDSAQFSEEYVTTYEALREKLLADVL